MHMLFKYLIENNKCIISIRYRYLLNIKINTLFASYNSVLVPYLHLFTMSLKFASLECNEIIFYN